MRITILKENSHKYIATICQIAGIACSSGFGSKIFDAVKHGNLNSLNFHSKSFAYSSLLLILGAIFLIVGWYIMYRIDSQKAKLEKKNDL